MDILKTITGNNSIQKMLIDKLIGMGKQQGFSKLIIDLHTENGEPAITEVKPNEILVDKETFDFYKDFFEENKNLITDKKD